MAPQFYTLFSVIILVLVIALIYNFSYFLYRLTDLFFNRFRKD